MEIKPEPIAFRAFRQFNQDDLRPIAAGKFRLDERGQRYFPGDNLADRLARALCRAAVIKCKEVLETFEFFERVRHRVRRPHMVDLCCGHGLVGMLYAIFEKSVTRVTLVDRKRPPSHDRIRDALQAEAPWLSQKLVYLEAKMNRIEEQLTPDCGIVGVHACGMRTDRCLDLALTHRWPIAVMPCCHSDSTCDAPRSVKQSLGIVMATDIHRTYRLEAANYDVTWSSIPEEISPMNRIIIGVP